MKNAELGEWDKILTSSEKTLYLNPKITQTDNFPEEPHYPDYLIEKELKYPLINTAVLTATGKDAENFLQSQLTCDVTKIMENEAVLTSWCAPNGRVKHLLNVLRSNETLFIAVSRDLVGKFLDQIGIYVLNSDVVFKDVSDSILAFISTPSLKKETKLQLGSVLETQNFWLESSASAISPNAITLLEIRQNTPRINLELSEKFLPQELNLHVRGGLSFEKGCFPGQEIIARVKYRGNIKRNLRVLESPGTLTNPPKIGDSVTDANGKKVGTILQVASMSETRTIVQSVLDVSISDFCYCNDNSDELVLIDS